MHLKESILGNFDDIINNSDQTIKESIKWFIEENYNISIGMDINISDIPDSDGRYRYIVNVKNHYPTYACVIIKLSKMKYVKSLTNGYFKWGKVEGGFYCDKSGVQFYIEDVKSVCDVKDHIRTCLEYLNY